MCVCVCVCVCVCEREREREGGREREKEESSFITHSQSCITTSLLLDRFSEHHPHVIVAHLINASPYLYISIAHCIIII